MSNAPGDFPHSDVPSPAWRAGSSSQIWLRRPLCVRVCILTIAIPDARCSFATLGHSRIGSGGDSYRGVVDVSGRAAREGTGHSRVSAAAPRKLADLQNIERATTPWPDELREFFSLHDGQDAWLGERLAGTLLLDMELLSLDGMQFERSSWLESPHEIDDLGDEWPAAIAAQQAGETAHLFLPIYVPIAKDGAGGLCYIDTRSGPKQGCVRFFSAEAADEGGPAYDSLADYLDALRSSVESETEFDGLVPTFDDGALVWDLDRSNQPQPPLRPEPVVLRLPFGPVEFRPSQWSAEDDVVDLDVVRRTVVDTARALHPGSVVDVDARAVYRYVPRLRGANMNWWVSVNGAERIFTAFVTGEGDEVIVVEALPGGYTVEVQD